MNELLIFLSILCCVSAAWLAADPALARSHQFSGRATLGVQFSKHQHFGHSGSTDILRTTTTKTTLFGVCQPFGEQQYWESWYQNRSLTSAEEEEGRGDDNHNKAAPNGATDDKDMGDFSWYASWEDIRPLFHEFFDDTAEVTNNDVVSIEKPTLTRSVLLPGIGMDAALVLDMHKQDGYTQLSAMDYAPASIDYVQKRWDEHLFKESLSSHAKQQQQPTTKISSDEPAFLDLCVADVRDLPYESGSFDAILDKGTLDAVYLCGNSPQEKLNNLSKGVRELQRVLKPNGGLFWSLSGICAQAMTELPDEKAWDDWELLADTRDSSIYSTQDGYTSNNVDGDLLVFRKK